MFFKALLKENLFVSNLISSWSNWFQSLGNSDNGSLAVWLSLDLGTNMLSLFLISWILASWQTHEFTKEDGRELCLNLCINCRLKYLIRSGKGKIWSCLNSGSVCALYFALEISLMACFCFLYSSDNVVWLAHPHICIPYTRWQCIVEK